MASGNRSRSKSSALVRACAPFLLACCLSTIFEPGTALASEGSRSPEAAPQRPDLPLWEAGLGVAPISFPDYRGSDRQQTYAFPLPYFVYRGDILRVDRDGLRGVILEQSRFELNLSASGSIPVRSDADGARAGMPDLDPIFELGISMNWEAMANDDIRVRLRLPVRAALASDLRSLNHVGWRAEPMINIETVEHPEQWALSFSTGPVIADRHYHAYFYSVPAEFATETRPEYNAPGGFSGWMAVATASRRFARTWVGAFFRYDNLTGASFENSPLVETRESFAAGLGIAWILGQSNRTANQAGGRSP